MDNDDTNPSAKAPELFNKEGPTAISLRGELDTLRHATEAALLIAEMHRRRPRDARSGLSAALSQRACAAVISLVACRLELVVEVIADVVEPARLGARHNLVRASAFGIQPEDILIPLGNTPSFVAAPRKPRGPRARVESSPGVDSEI